MSELRIAAINAEGNPVDPLANLSPLARDACLAHAELYGSAGFVPPWIGYLACDGYQCVGACGFKGPPMDNLPGDELATQKMPGHWVLARLGKRVLRPEGIGLTRWLIDVLHISDSDDVVELAPGLGVTVRLVLKCRPHSYTGIERDSAAAVQVTRRLKVAQAQCLVGHAEDSGLPNGCATVVLVAAMLSMQPHLQKTRIVAEAIASPFGHTAG